MTKINFYMSLGSIDNFLCFACIGEHARKAGRAPLYLTVYGAEKRARAREAARLGLNKFDIITDKTVRVYVTLTVEQAETAVLNINDYLSSAEYSYYAAKNPLFASMGNELASLAQKLTSKIAKC